MFISKKIIGALGPQENLFINSIKGKGSKFGFLIYSYSENNLKRNFHTFAKIKSLDKSVHKRNMMQQNVIVKPIQDISITNSNRLLT